MRLDEVTPRAITESGYALGGADQIREEDGCESALQLGFFLKRGAEVLKFSQHASHVPCERSMLFAGQLDDSCISQLVSEVSRLLDSLDRIICPVHHERRDRHSLEQRSNVGLALRPSMTRADPRRGGQARVARPL
jgi:hypothetical protein